MRRRCRRLRINRRMNRMPRQPHPSWIALVRTPPHVTLTVKFSADGAFVRAGRVLLVDADPLRRGTRAAALRARGLAVDEASDAIDALKQLPTLSPDLLVVAADGLRMDADTLARGVHSMRAAAHCQILVLGDARPVSASLPDVTVLPDSTALDALTKDAERLAQRAIRRRP